MGNKSHTTFIPATRPPGVRQCETPLGREARYNFFEGICWWCFSDRHGTNNFAVVSCCRKAYDKANTKNNFSGLVAFKAGRLPLLLAIVRSICCIRRGIQETSSSSTARIDTCDPGSQKQRGFGKAKNNASTSPTHQQGWKWPPCWSSVFHSRTLNDPELTKLGRKPSKPITPTRRTRPAFHHTLFRPATKNLIAREHPSSSGTKQSTAREKHSPPPAKTQAYDAKKTATEADNSFETTRGKNRAHSSKRVWPRP